MISIETVLAFLTAIGSGVAILTFWLRFSDRITKAGGAAQVAEKDAMEAKSLADSAHTRITAMAAEFGMYRERVATEYVTRENLRDIERRLMTAIEKIDNKLDTMIHQHGN